MRPIERGLVRQRVLVQLAAPARNAVLDADDVEQRIREHGNALGDFFPHGREVLPERRKPVVARDAEAVRRDERGADFVRHVVHFHSEKMHDGDALGGILHRHVVRDDVALHARGERVRDGGVRVHEHAVRADAHEDIGTHAALRGGHARRRDGRAFRGGDVCGELAVEVADAVVALEEQLHARREIHDTAALAEGAIFLGGHAHRKNADAKSALTALPLAQPSARRCDCRTASTRRRSRGRRGPSSPRRTSRR